MSEQEFNKIFATNLQRYMDDYDMNRTELAKRLGVSTVTVYNWLNGIKAIRMPKVDQICELFHCNRSDLIVENVNDDDISDMFNKLDNSDKEAVRNMMRGLLSADKYKKEKAFVS